LGNIHLHQYLFFSALGHNNLSRVAAAHHEFKNRNIRSENDIKLISKLLTIDKVPSTRVDIVGLRHVAAFPSATATIIKYYPPASPMYWLLPLVHCGYLIRYSVEIEEIYAHVRSSPLFSLVASSSMGALESWSRGVTRWC
jgi:hypothetical protein